MKKTVFILLFIIPCGLTIAQFHKASINLSPTSGILSDASLILQVNFGYTFVEVSEAIDLPEYEPFLTSYLNDWDNVNMNFYGILLFNRSESISYGIEAGMNRLYWWEEKETPIGFSPRWYWSSVWSFHCGGIIRFNMKGNIYFFSGFLLHVFTDDSGITAGIPAAFGYDLPISSTLAIPVEFRADVIFGNATPIGIGGGIGLKFNL